MTGMTPQNQRILRKNLLIEAHGEPDKQKFELVKEILGTFESPDRWPMDDGSRSSFLRKLFHMAHAIRETETAIEQAKIDA